MKYESTMVYEIYISIDESVHTVMILLSQRINMTMSDVNADSQWLIDEVGIWNVVVIWLIDQYHSLLGMNNIIITY